MKQFTSNTKPSSPATAALLYLLSSYSRQQIYSAIMLEEEPESALIAPGGPSLRALHPLARQNAGNKSQDLNTSSEYATLGYFDPHYPQLLREIPDPPLVLFYVGNTSLLVEPGIAVVGARRCTTQGRSMAETLAQDLVGYGVHVTSGMALGIDGAAHRGALKAKGPGSTIAVLGAGLRKIYPPRHESLAREIVAAGGLLLSEYTAGTPPRPFRFPERNRLISGLSIATVVVEAGDRSGSLITARLAAEQGRDVLAVPGPVGNLVSQGCHRLIQQGAALVTSAQEVLDCAGLEAAVLRSASARPKVSVAHPEAGCVNSGARIDDPVLAALFAQIQGYPVGFDELAATSKLRDSDLARALVELELTGFVQQGPLGYIRTS